MDALASVITALDDAHDHRWESMESALRGTGDDEAAWQPEAFREEPPEPGWPHAGTILWHVNHVANCASHYADCIEQRPIVDVESPPWNPLSTFASALTALRSSHVRLRSIISRLPPTAMSEPIRGDIPLDRFVAMAIRHVVWHAAQVALVRRFWRKRPTSQDKTAVDAAASPESVKRAPAEPRS
jgi:hypothetical protein